MPVISDNWLHQLFLQHSWEYFYDHASVTYKLHKTWRRIPLLCTLRKSSSFHATDRSRRKKKIFQSHKQITPAKCHADWFKSDRVKIHEAGLSQNTEIFAMETSVSLHSLLQLEYLQFWLATVGADKPPLLEAHEGNKIRITTTM